VRVQPIAAPASWESAGVRFTVWHPAADWHPETPDNARSLVLDVACADRHLVLTGDLEQLGLSELVRQPHPDPPPEVFLAPHHGGKSANPGWLYDWARPKLVVVSQRPLPAGTNDPLTPVEHQGIRILRTWREGAIRLQWTEGGVVPRGFLQDEGREVRELDQVHVLSGIGSWQAPLLPAWVGQGTLRLLVGLAGFTLGLMLCIVLAVVEFGAWALIVPPRSMTEGNKQTDGEAPPPARHSEPIEARGSDGAKLAGRWYPAPALTTTGRTVLLLHGFAEDSSALELRRVATLNQHGWNVAALDSRGCGQSEGRYATFGGREAGDIRAWLDVLARLAVVIDPALRFSPVLWGRSMGAAIAVRAAAQTPGLAALVLESPLVELDAAVAVLMRKRGLPFPKILARLITRRAARLAGVSLSRPRSIDLAPRVACPILIVHGSNDALVSTAEARMLSAAFPSPPCWFDVPGAGHTDVIDAGGDELLGRIAAFLDGAAVAIEPMRDEAGQEK
jgi:alpha-beta hydrolase superfamily lysophospholipase